MIGPLLDDDTGVPGTINGALVGVGPAPCVWIVNDDGTIFRSGAGGDQNWVDPATVTVAANYQVKVDPTSGSFDSGSTGTWLDCSSAPEWHVNSGTVEFTVSFREKATGLMRSVQTGILMGD